MVDEVGGDFAGEGTEVDDRSGEPGFGDVIDGEGIGDGEAVLDAAVGLINVVVDGGFGGFDPAEVGVG